MTESGVPPEFSADYCSLKHSNIDETVKRIDTKINGLIILLSTGALSLLMFLLKETISRLFDY